MSDTSIVISARSGVCNSFFTKSFSGRFPFCLPHPDARIRVSIMIGLTQAKAHWRAREWKNFLYKISTISECLYRNRLLTSDLIGSFIRPVRLCLYLFRTYVTSLFFSQIHFWLDKRVNRRGATRAIEKYWSGHYLCRAGEGKKKGVGAGIPSDRFVKSITLPIFIHWFVIE